MVPLFFLTVFAAGAKVRDVIGLGTSRVVNPYYDVNTKSDVVEYRVEKYKPTPLAAIGMPGDTYVCFDKPTTQSGCVDSSTEKSFTLKGDEDNINLWYTDKERKTINSFPLKLVGVPSQETRLQSISMSGGRLDPPFRPSQYVYYGRINNGKSTSLNVKSMSPESSDCYYKGQLVKGSISATIPKGRKIQEMEIECRAKDDRSRRTTYVVTLVDQGNKNTQLKELGVVGASFDRPFDPSSAGEYVVSNRTKGNLKDLNFVALKPRPKDKDATVMIDGKPIHPEGAPFVHVMPGDKATFRLSVKSPNNPLEEDYYVTVDRSDEKPASRSLMKLARGVGLFGLLGGAHSSPDVFMQQVSNAQFPSVLSRAPGQPNSANVFCSAMNCPFNMQGCYSRPVSDKFRRSVHMVDSPRMVDIHGQEINAYNPSVKLALESDGNPDYCPYARRLDAGDEVAHFQSVVDELTQRITAREALTDYSRALVLNTALLTSIAIGYVILYFVYLKRGAEFGHIRRDFPTVLHPSIFWPVVMDAALIMFGQTTAGLMFINVPKETTIAVFGSELSRKILTIISAAIFLAIPVAYLMVVAFILFKVRKNLVFSRSLARYHYKYLTHAKAVHNRFAWIPLLGPLFEWQIRNVSPIKRCKKTDGVGPLIFEDDVDTKKGDEIRGEYEQIGGNAAHPQYNEKTDSVRVNLDVGNYYLNMKESTNARLVAKYPNAVVFSKRAFVINSYCWPVVLNCDIPFRALNNFAELFDTVSVNVKTNQLDTAAEEYKVLKDATCSMTTVIGQAPRKLPFYYVIDRLALVLLVVVLATQNFGTAQYYLQACTALCFIMAILYVPFAIKTGTTKYRRAQSALARLKSNAQMQQTFEDEDFQVWPYSDPKNRENFLRLYKRKQDGRLLGMYKLYRVCWKEPMQKLPESSFWYSKAYHILKEITEGIVMVHILRGLAMICLFFANSRTSKTNPAIASFGAIIFICLSIMLFRFSSTWTNLLKQIAEFLHVTGTWIKDKTLGFLRALMKPSSWIPRIKHFFSQLTRMCTFRSYNFHLEDWTYRNSEVRDVTLICNEVGVQLPSKVVEAENIRKRIQIADRHDRKRFRLHKTLVVAGTTGAQCVCEYRKSLPVQTPLSQFCKMMHSRVTKPRLIATIQVVNHRLRSEVTNQRKGCDHSDDSFLSLYADPKLLPDVGVVSVKQVGHGVSVRFNNRERTVVVRTPEIVGGTEYTLQTANKRDATSTSSSVSEAGQAKVQCTCREPGRLNVKLPHAPHPHELVHVQSPYTEQIIVDPNLTHISYDSVNREMQIRHAKLRPSNEDYNVSIKYKSVERSEFKLKARAEEYGQVSFPYEYKDLPQFNNWLLLTDENGKSTEVDASHTDRYQFALPSHDLYGVSKTLYGMANSLKNLTSYVKALPSRDDVTVRTAVPCTVIQCVDPISKQYRVDPNFGSVQKVIRANLEEQQACLSCVTDEAMLSKVWPSIMSLSDFCRYFERKGVMPERGHGFCDPLAVPLLKEFQGQEKTIESLRGDFINLLQNRINNKIELLNKQLTVIGSWKRAYEDSELRATQEDYEVAEWSNMKSQSQRLRVNLKKLRKKYSDSIPGFIYPMTVDGSVISKRPNMAAQFRKWQQQIENWLVSEEGILARHTTEPGHLALQTRTRDILAAVNTSLESKEDPAARVFKSALHYVVGSHMIRGPRAPWRPDPLAANSACVRVFRTDANGRPDITKPSWLPCSIKVSATDLKIIVPIPTDEEDDNSMYGRNSIRAGWYVPLCAFEKVDAYVDRSIPAGAESVAALTAGSMSGTLIFRKNQKIQVDDNFVKMIRDNKFKNQVHIMDGSSTNVYSIVIGHTVPSSEGLDRTEEDAEVTKGSKDGLVNVAPMMIKMREEFVGKYQRMIRTYLMDRPHQHFVDGRVVVVPTPQSSSSSEPPKVQSREESSSTSSPSSYEPPPKTTSSVSSTSSSSEEAVDEHAVYSCDCPIAYRGQWAQDRSMVGNEPDGHGVMMVGDMDKRSSKNVTLHGTFKNGNLHGEGVMLKHGGRVYVKGLWDEGVFKGGKRCVIDIHPTVMQEYGFRRYCGSVVDGKFHNVGKLVKVDGSEWTGTFVDGQISGIGRMMQKGGVLCLDGIWKNGVFSGNAAKLPLKDGYKYSGLVDGNKRIGVGELYDKNNKLVYEGGWNNDQFHDRGILYCADGTYDGQFSKGRRHGKGAFTYSTHPAANGNLRVYSGTWYQDKPHGTGRYTAEDGSTNVYNFINGNLSPESLKKYKKGLCGKAPNVERKVAVAPVINPSSAQFSFSPGIDGNLTAKVIGNAQYWLHHTESGHGLRLANNIQMPPAPRVPTSHSASNRSSSSGSKS